MKSKLPNYILSLFKISITLNKENIKWVPLPPLDRIWDDDKIYKFFKITKEEEELIEDNIKDYKKIKSN